jgi:hypothetical protein
MARSRRRYPRPAPASATPPRPAPGRDRPSARLPAPRHPQGAPRPPLRPLTARHRPSRRTRYPLPGQHARRSQRDCAAGGPPHPPRIPPARLLPFTINGNLAAVTIHHGGIHIERTRADRINGNHSAGISWQELAGIDFLEPNFFRNGHVHFAAFDDPARPDIHRQRQPHGRRRPEPARHPVRLAPIPCLQATP